MENKSSIEWLEEQVKDLCVKTYLEILGYGCYISSRGGYAGFPALYTAEGILYVDRNLNKYRFGPKGIPRGGVLEFASQNFQVSKDEILRNPSRYRIDILLIVRGHIRSAVWTPWHMPGEKPESPIPPPPIPQRLASFFTKS